MTDLIYARDASVRRFSATVVTSDEDSRAVVLDATAFYPGGGGQPHDAGTLLTADGRSWPVTAVVKSGGTVVHTLGGEEPLPEPGEGVSGELDWERRYRLMRTHTALHILCGVVFRDYGAKVTGGNMDTDKARMDFELDDFGPERAAEIERRANAEVVAARPVRVVSLPRDEAFAIPDLIRTKINLLPEGITEVRTVELVGLDLQADGGTHVANTREVGGIQVVGTRSKGKANKRLEAVLIDAPPGDGGEDAEH